MRRSAKLLTSALSLVLINSHDRSHQQLTCRAYWRGFAIGTLQFPIKAEQPAATCLNCLVFKVEKDVGFTNTNNQRPKLITFCGLPGSGKTTIAKELAKTTGAVRLNVDEWVAALGVDFWDDAFRHKLHARLYEHGITLLKLGQSIMLEDGVWKRDERDRLREVAHELGAAIELHYFDVPFDELWRRLEARNAMGTFGVVPISKEILKACLPRFQPPDEAELALFDSYVVHT
jgi:predicted kinase